MHLTISPVTHAAGPVIPVVPRQRRHVGLRPHWRDALTSIDASTFGTMDQSALDADAATGRPHHDTPNTGLLTSMFEALELAGGDTILQVGTDTGYLVALLCHVLSDRAVTSVEQDKAAAFAARTALGAVGFRLTVVTGHELHGWLGHGPYDRVMSLRSPWRLPPAWIAQTRREGRILTPLGAHGMVFALGVANDLSHATGPALPIAVPTGAFPLLPPDGTLPALGNGRRLPTSTTGQVWAASHLLNLVLADPAFNTLLGLALPHLDHYTSVDPHGGAVHVWTDRAQRPSWARLRIDGELTHAGPRLLASDLVGLADWWIRAGAPTPDRWGLMVHATGQHTLWLDQPTNPRLGLPSAPPVS